LSAALIWIILPAGLAVILFAFQKWEKIVILIGTLASLTLAWFAWTEPIGETWVLGTIRLELVDIWVVLGRRFVITPSDTPVLILIYLGLAFWFGGTIIARPSPYFISIGLAIAALLTAAIAVEPFLYAALLLELVTILSIPLLSPPGQPAGQGALRFLTFQTLAIPFILFSGWILAGIGAGLAESELIVQGNILLAFGFALLLGVFPFHTWVPMIAEEAHPFIAAFIFYIYSLGITFLGIEFLERYAWLRNSEGLFNLLQVAGTVVVIVSGLWAAFQNHLGRLLGFAILMETGLSLLTVSLGAGEGGLFIALEILFTSLLPRGLAFGTWALALATLAGSRNGKFSSSLKLNHLKGEGRKYPIAIGILIMAILSVVGLPLLAGFPVRIALWEALAQKSGLAAAVALLGSIGLMTGALRSLAILISAGEDPRWTISEKLGNVVMLVIGGLAIVILGIFPQWFLPALARLTQVYFGILP